MSFPLCDNYWVDTANFVQSHIKPGENLLAPDEFGEKFINHYSYSAPREEAANLQWVVIHKGMMEAIDYVFLEGVTQKLIPVFANEVFVVFSSQGNLSQVETQSVHIQAFWENMKLLKSIGKNLLNPQSDRGSGKVFFNVKDIGSTSRTELELACRAMSQTTYLGNQTVLCRVLTKYLCYVDAEDKSLTPHLCMNGYWESWITQAVVRLLQPGWNCVDIGANCGYYSLLMADAVGPSGRILAAEPNPRLATLLRQSLDLNGFRNHATVSQTAVADTNGERVNLVIPGNGLLGDATIARPATLLGDKVVEVETVTLDELTKDWSHVDLVKIDAEGAEDAIWHGMRQTVQKHKNIVVIMEFCCYRSYEPKAFLEDILAAGLSLGYIDNDSQVKNLTIEECLTGRPGEYWDLFLQRR